MKGNLVTRAIEPITPAAKLLVNIAAYYALFLFGGWSIGNATTHPSFWLRLETAGWMMGLGFLVSLVGSAHGSCEKRTSTTYGSIMLLVGLLMVFLTPILLPLTYLWF